MSFIFFFFIQYYFLIYQEILRKKESNAPDSFFKLQSCFATRCFRISWGTRTKNGTTPAACLACAGKKLLSHLVAFSLLAQPSKGSKIPSTTQNNHLLINAVTMFWQGRGRGSNRAQKTRAGGHAEHHNFHRTLSYYRVLSTCSTLSVSIPLWIRLPSAHQTR